MAEISTLGPRAAADLIYGVGGIDAARVLNFLNANGITPQQAVAIAASAIGEANQYITQTWGGVLYATEMDHVKYRQGDTGRKTPVATDYSAKDPVYSSETGHMLPLRDFQDFLAWTAVYLEDAYISQLEADGQLMAESWINRAENDIVRRMLLTTENAQGSGYDVPWSIGTGVNVSFIPAAYGGQSFTTAHTHFEFYNGANAAACAALADQMMEELRHHGISGTLQLLVSYTDVALWTGMTGFVEITPAGQTIVAVPSGSEIRSVTGETSGVPGELLGYYKSKKFGTAEIRAYYRIPTKYAFCTKSYGVNNPMNGLALRLRRGKPFGLAPAVEIDTLQLPRIKGIRLEASHGVGVNKRLNGVAGFFDTGASAYVDPTIS